MSKNNQKTYRLLGAADSGLFTVDGREVIALFDVPHIFKCIRNAFAKYDIEVGGELSSWRYLETLHALDSASSPRVAPKLSQQHISPNRFEKMKSQLCPSSHEPDGSRSHHDVHDLRQAPTHCTPDCYPPAAPQQPAGCTEFIQSVRLLLQSSRHIQSPSSDSGRTHAKGGSKMLPKVTAKTMLLNYSSHFNDLCTIRCALV